MAVVLLVSWLACVSALEECENCDAQGMLQLKRDATTPGEPVPVIGKKFVPNVWAPEYEGSSESFVECKGETFLDCWSFFTEPDPTHGDVVYVSQEEANNLGLYQLQGDSVFLGSLLGKDAPAKSIRLQSKKRFGAGYIFVIDIEHMPHGMGTWPAWWSYGQDWPENGEIDTIETVNQQNVTQSTLHTSAGCVMNIPGIFHAACNTGGAAMGCGLWAPNATGGLPFNEHEGGVFATAWTEEGISMWYWPRDKIPTDLAENKVNTTAWGEPYVNFPFGDNCPSSHFNSHVMVINLTFCGDWAGNVFPGGIEACKKFIRNPENIGKLVDAYWKINYVKVFPSTTVATTMATTVAANATALAQAK